MFVLPGFMRFFSLVLTRGRVSGVAYGSGMNGLGFTASG